MPLGAGLLRLVGFQRNINALADIVQLGNLGAGFYALADIVQLGNLGAGFFQLGIFRCSLPAESVSSVYSAVLCPLRVAYSFSHSAMGRLFVPFGRFAWR